VCAGTCSLVSEHLVLELGHTHKLVASRVDAHSESFDFLLLVCSELRGVVTVSGGLQYRPSRNKTDW
jgi:hypothetical protein